MPLYLGLDAGAQGLTAIDIEIEGSLRRIVFSRTLSLDRDFPEYGTTGGMRRSIASWAGLPPRPGSKSSAFTPSPAPHTVTMRMCINTCPASNAAPIAFRNGALARDRVRTEHHLDWDSVAKLLDQSPGNDGCLMLPWIELETTPPIAHAGVRRFGFDRHDTARNVRGLIEGQMMAMANHVPVAAGATVEKVIATGEAVAHRAILQVMANVFGAKVYRLDSEHAAALGAALRAYHADRLGAGEPVSWMTVVSGFTDPKPGHRVSPNPKYVAIYAELRKDYAILERLHQHRRPIC